MPLNFLESIRSDHGTVYLQTFTKSRVPKAIQRSSGPLLCIQQGRQSPTEALEAGNPECPWLWGWGSHSSGTERQILPSRRIFLKSKIWLNPPCQRLNLPEAPHPSPLSCSYFVSILHLSHHCILEAQKLSDYRSSQLRGIVAQDGSPSSLTHLWFRSPSGKTLDFVADTGMISDSGGRWSGVPVFLYKAQV